jgi:uncharacterized protein
LHPASSTDTPLTETADGVRIAVRLTPRARANRIEGIAHLADGAARLKVTVTAPPADGRANDALLLLLAKEWRLPRRELTIVGGQKSRNKVVHIAGDPPVLLKRLGGALAALPES